MFPSQLPDFDLDAEAVLDDAIHPLPNPVDLSAPPRAIFLTGATGFVGAYLLHELLQQTDATLYCLVRAKDSDDGLQRIRTNLQDYDLWSERLARRVVPVIGDLKGALLDLSEKEFDRFADIIDVIYHCGSKLSYVAPYEYLKAANVGGTQEILRLATRKRNKPVHYVSSLGILMAYQALIGGQEHDDLDASKCPDVGYFRSKYVSERVMRIGRERGIPVTIHRIGLIVGDSRTGVCNVDDFVARILIGGIQAGYAPDIRNAMDMTPVDYIARAMVYLAQRSESDGQVFHLLNPHPIHWSDIFDFVSEAGYPVQKVAFHHWVQAVEETADPDTNPLYPLMPFFHIQFARRMLGIDDSHFQALGRATTLRALSASGVVCPEVDRTLVHTFLDYFVNSGRLHTATVVESEVSAVAV
jgi:thioester reductase-like protein